MQKYGLFVKLTALSGKEDELSKFLTSAADLANAEVGTKNWYAFKENENTFGIFDTFDSENDRRIHLNGKIASALMEKAPELIAGTVTIHSFDILAQK